MQDILQRGQKLLQKLEKHNAIVTKTLDELHELAATAVKDNGKQVGLDDTQIAALVIPKEPRNPG